MAANRAWLVNIRRWVVDVLSCRRANEDREEKELKEFEREFMIRAMKKQGSL